MTNSEIVVELKKMVKDNMALRDVLKKKDENHYSPENITKEENDLIYKNIDKLDIMDWRVENLDRHISMNKRMIEHLS